MKILVLVIGVMLSMPSTTHAVKIEKSTISYLLKLISLPDNETSKSFFKWYDASIPVLAIWFAVYSGMFDTTGHGDHAWKPVTKSLAARLMDRMKLIPFPHQRVLT